MKPVISLLAYELTLFISLLLTCSAARSDLSPEIILKNLQSPWALAFISESEALITLKGGELLRANLNNQKTIPVSGVPESVIRGQGGLLDIELHPQFTNNQWIYLTFTRKTIAGYTTALAKARLQSHQLTGSKVIFTAQAYASGGRHFGSRLAFDNLGYLYMSIGDRGQRDFAQDLMRHNGKIIRLLDDGKIPADNPFIGNSNALPEIYSYGHRNPQGMVFDKKNNQLWIHEHGPMGGDELNLILPGKNYGWPLVSYGREYYGPRISEHTELPGVENPVFYWVPSIAPSGMTIYDHDRFKEWQGDILIGALKYQLITRVIMEDTKALAEQRYLEGSARIRDIKTGPDGAIYVLTDGANGQLWRIVPG
jgi:aldose sugar dehydrogenase